MFVIERQPEARDYICTIANRTTRELVSLALSAAERAVIFKTGEFRGILDAVVFVRVVEHTMAKHETLKMLLNGGSLAWVDDAAEGAELRQ